MDNVVRYKNAKSNLNYDEIVIGFGVYDNITAQEKLEKAVTLGHLDKVKEAVSAGADISLNDNYALQRASNGGYIEVVKYLHTNGADIRAKRDYALQLASSNGHLEVVKYLHTNGADVKAENNYALQLAASNGHLEVVKYLHTNGADINTKSSHILKNVLENNHTEVADYFIKNGIENLQENDNKLSELNSKWLKVAGINCPRGLDEVSPYYFNLQEFNKIKKLFIREDYGQIQSNIYAYHNQALFGSEQRLLEYFRRWGKNSKQPLHDLVQNISISRTGRINLKLWSDATMKCGPAMAKLVKFANKMEMPEKSSDGKTWSSVNTAKKLIQFIYLNSEKNPDLALFCLKNAVGENEFDKALSLLDKAPLTKNLPDIYIDGKNFGIPDAKFYKLSNNDFRGLFLGELVDCCQKLGGVGEKCAEHGFVSEEGAFYVVERKSQIIGETWAWRGREGELVWDSFETLGNRISNDVQEKLSRFFALALENNNPYNVTSFNIGLGGRTSSSLKDKFEIAVNPAKPKDYKEYRDSAEQIVVWKNFYR